MSLQATDLPSAMLQEPQEQPRLMVVDDEVSSAQALRLYLVSQGYDVHMEYSGKRALDEIPRFKPHLLILDLMMPDISGLDVIMKIRSDPKLKYIPVIMITGHDEERRRLQSMISGADDYLAKPVNKLELLVRVQALLRTKTHIDRLWQENHLLLEDLESRNSELEQALEVVEAANMLKRNILNTVSHEMGTPLLQIKSAVHLLIEDIRKSEPDNLPAELVTQALTRLEGIVQNVTDLARSENLKQEPFLMADAVDLAVRNIERSWNGKFARDRIRADVE
ncbi:MAG TPA: response regulator, partial [Aggregatilineales bacterium]|nr:response regulator [Aggregatilineales bacterium]